MLTTLQQAVSDCTRRFKVASPPSTPRLAEPPTTNSQYSIGSSTPAEALSFNLQSSTVNALLARPADLVFLAEENDFKQRYR
eukprot:PDM68901.1 hypothetical protein PRIPAC_47203 [Pristionchus pacificus]